MQNSLEHSFFCLLRSITEDVIAYKPSHRKDIVRDLSRISSLAENMGVRLFTEHLPALRKQLDSSLSVSQLSLVGPLSRSYKKSSQIPRLFKGIWLEIFSDDGCLKQDIDPNFIFFLRTILDIGSKLEMKCPPAALYREVREFYATDVSLPPPSKVFDGDGSDLADDHIVNLTQLSGNETDQYDLLRSDDSPNTELLASVQRVADMVATSIGIINTSEIGYRHGRGAVSDGLRGIEKHDVRRWSDRLSRVFPIETVVHPAAWPHWYDTSESHSELWDVIKTVKGPRLIAKEPVDHMVCQLGIMDFLYDHIKSNSFLSKSIDFRRQDFSRDLALESSKSREYATIDLKSASDRISCWLIERIFRRNHSLLEALISCRTRYINLGIDKTQPKLHKLRKFSTQGSAVTFPIQSIVFATICVGAVAPANASAKKIRELFRRVRVYGDDIIVPVDWLERVKYCLELLYLKVNTQKTHSQGYFRESCGMDAWDGHDVTPPHVTVLDTQAKRTALSSIIEASNNFFSKGLWHASDYLLSTVSERDRRSILIRREPDVSIHLKSFLGNLTPKTVKSRVNKDYQIEEVLALTKTSEKRSLKVDGTTRLSAFLMRTAYMNREPYLGMVPEVSYTSRWELREKITKQWVPLAC